MEPYLDIFPIVLVATVLLVGVSVLLARTPRTTPDGLNSGTRFFLVALRLAIGWHFFIEGVEKLHTPTWSSEPYLRESIGPAAPYFRQLAGDHLLDQFRLGPNNTLPPTLASEWDAYFE